MPLAFKGKKMGEAGKFNEKAKRWHELAIYMTDQNQFVVHLGYRTKWTKEERDWDEAVLMPTPDSVVQWLSNKNPCEHVLGPLEDKARQDRIKEAVQVNYKHLVGEVLESCGFSEVVK